MLMSTPSWKFDLFRYSILVIIPFIPFGAFLILKIFRENLPKIFLILSTVSIIISIPLSRLLLELVNHEGGHDYIHSLKSGFVIPLWFFSIGLLIVGRAKFAQRQHGMNCKK